MKHRITDIDHVAMCSAFGKPQAIVSTQCCRAFLALAFAFLSVDANAWGTHATQPANQQNNQQPQVIEKKIPVIDREPFDRLTFNDANENRVLDVDPIEFEGVGANTPIDPGNMKGRLVFTMPDHPDRVFAVGWSHLVKVDRYSELVLDESRQAMEANDYATAFRTLTFMQENTDLKDSVELRQMMDKCLFGDGEKNLADGLFSEALAAFEELYRRNPRFVTGSDDTVLDKITAVIDQFVEKQIDDGEFEKARETLRYITREYGARMDSLVDVWQAEMTKRALDELKTAQSHLEQGQGDLAQKSVRKLLYVNPELAQAKTAHDTVMAKFPFVYVGVAQPALDKDVRRIDNWASRRVGRLTSRWLMEFDGPGDEGGQYQFPSGRFQRIDDLGVEYRFELGQDRPFGVPDLTSYEIANRLMELANPESPEYSIPWARIVETIEIEDETAVAFKLRNPHVRPDALLQIPYYSQDDERFQKDNGVYVEIAKQDNETIYEFNSEFARPGGFQLPRVIERVYKNMSDATEALIRGELDVVDRVFPADIVRLKNHPQIEVRPYIVPNMHMLIPNPRNAYMKSDHFRRALHFGINRNLILDQLIAGGAELDGFEVTSGPFPPGTETSDQFAYAYNFDVKPREFSGQLSMVLAQQFINGEKIRLEKEGQLNPKIEKPNVILAHPDSDLIGAICQAIAQQWRSVGIDTELRVLPVGVTIPEDNDYDLLFCEIQIQEPLVDANRLFGKNGLVKMIDPTIEQALRQLDSSYAWGDVSKSLRRVHEQTANNLTVLPLWQMVEHFAFRKNVFNVGDQLVFLYQNLSRWRITGQQSQVSKK